MTDPKANVAEIVAEAIEGLVQETSDHFAIAYAAIGALTAAGFAIVPIDASAIRRALADKHVDGE
jgi:hypothetical protein